MDFLPATISEEDVHRSSHEAMGMSEGQVAAFLGNMWQEYLDTLNVEILEYFRSLRPAYRTTILSNNFVGAREREEAFYRFHEACDFIIYSPEVRMAKPDPRIYALACERLALQPAEVVVLDDRGWTADVAREVGIDVRRGARRTGTYPTTDQ